MAPPDGRRFPTGLQAFQRVCTDGIEHIEARLVADPCLLIDERLVDQRLEAIQEIDPEIAIAGTDRGGSGERPAAGKDGQAYEQTLFRHREQVVAPVDGCADRLLARR